MADLSDEHRRFVEEYLIDLNATRAYMVAFPESSYDAARANSARLIARDNIQEAIAQGVKDRSARTQVTQDRVLLEIARLAFNDPRRAFDEAGNLLPVQQWPDEVAAAISSIKIKRVVEGDVPVEVAEIKFWDKNSAIDKASKHLGMYEIDNRQKGQVRVTLADTDENI